MSQVLTVWLRKRSKWYDVLRQNVYADFSSMLACSVIDIIITIWPQIFLCSHHEYTELYMVVIAVIIYFLYEKDKRA